MQHVFRWTLGQCHTQDIVITLNLIVKLFLMLFNIRQICIQSNWPRGQSGAVKPIGPIYLQQPDVTKTLKYQWFCQCICIQKLTKCASFMLNVKLFDIFFVQFKNKSKIWAFYSQVTLVNNRFHIPGWCWFIEMKTLFAVSKFVRQWHVNPEATRSKSNQRGRAHL